MVSGDKGIHLNLRGTNSSMWSEENPKDLGAHSDSSVAVD